MLVLNSPGGNVVAGETLASTIRQMRMPVVIGDVSVCASACFTVFAASPRNSI